MYAGAPIRGVRAFDRQAREKATEQCARTHRVSTPEWLLFRFLTGITSADNIRHVELKHMNDVVSQGSCPAACLLRFIGDACCSAGGLIGSEVRMLSRGGYQRNAIRAGWSLLVIPLLMLWQGVNWVCLLLDEVLFPAARRVRIVKPLIILGPPRSGTTCLHRLLAGASDDFQTAPACELLFAPSVLQKKISRALLRLDRRLGSPLRCLWGRLEARLLRCFADTHPGSLRDPEEDYFYLNPLFACTGWLMAFPAWRSLYQWMPGCGEASEVKRRRALQFYFLCLQKQLYVRATDQFLLSKNASFSSWMDLLPEIFPDARWVICMRSPLETLPSMLSTAEEAQRGFFAETTDEDGLRPRLERCMQAHYQTLHRCVPGLPAHQVVVIQQGEIQHRLPEVLALLAEQFDLNFRPEFLAEIPAMAAASASHRSRHGYALSDYGLDGVSLIQSCPELASTLTRSR